MPLYNYKCTECGELFTDVPQSINDDKFTVKSQIQGAKCKCKKKDSPVKRLIGQIMKMNLIGEGFHSNDYAKNYEVLQGKDGIPGKTRPKRKK